MYLNDFSVKVVPGHETPGGYVEIGHGQPYALSLRTNRFMPCDARVEIDGKHVGTWRIPEASSIQIEHPAYDQALFTAYLRGSREGAAAKLDQNNPDLGLIKVTFTPGHLYKPPQRVKSLIDPNQVPDFRQWGAAEYKQSFETKWPNEDSKGSGSSRGGHSASSVSMASTPRPANYQAVGTGLSGHSNQIYGEAAPLDYDYTQQTVINLRLVSAKSDSGPRPLTVSENPVPPRIW